VQLSELPALEVCCREAAPPRKVWALISDITRVGDWGGECVHAEWITRVLAYRRTGQADEGGSGYPVASASLSRSRRR